MSNNEPFETTSKSVHGKEDILITKKPNPLVVAIFPLIEEKECEVWEIFIHDERGNQVTKFIVLTEDQSFVLVEEKGDEM